MKDLRGLTTGATDGDIGTVRGGDAGTGCLSRPLGLRRGRQAQSWSTTLSSESWILRTPL